MPTDLLPLALLTPVLLLTIFSDLRRMRIPNSYSLIALASFAAFALFAPPNDLTLRIVAAAIVFAVGFAGFSFRLLGGGDVKILAALMLFIPSQTLVLFGNVLSASLLVGVLTVLLLRRIPVAAGSGWTGIWGGARFPMGLSIGLAGLAHPWIVVLLAQS